jgi:hypothetical protein
MIGPAQTGGIELGALIGGVLVALAGLWTLRIAARSVGRLTSMVGVSTEPVESVEPGSVEVEGTVRPAGETVSGRMSDGDAVVAEYRSKSWRRDRDGDGDGTGYIPPLPQSLTPNALNNTASVPFYVEDDTGEVLVDPVKADVSLSADETDSRRHGYERRQREVEALLEPGDEVYVLGHAVPTDEYSPPERGGLLYRLFRLLGGDYKQIPASEVIEDEDLVITRKGEGTEFVVADTAEWRGWIRQVLMALLWSVISLALFAIGGYFALTGAGVAVPLPF